MPTVSSQLYTFAAKTLAPLLRLPFVESIYIRRSVAAGEAEFPWSDLDLGMVIGECSGLDLVSLLRRFRLAQGLFPRLGECLVATAEEVAEMAEMDPYRASLDRRFAIVAGGVRPPIPVLPIAKLAAARRLVFWFEHYLPLAVRQKNTRNQRKFVKEMANALGVVEGRWPEPRRSRAETELPTELPEGSAFAQCCYLAERAQRQLRPPAPRLGNVVQLPSLVILPSTEATMPASLAPRTMVVTPAVLDLLMATQSPTLWLQHRETLERLGFAPPPVEAWWEYCYRQVSGERFRLPGFCESGPIRQAERLAGVERLVDKLVQAAPLRDLPAVTAIPPRTNLRAYYQNDYEHLAVRAKELRTAIQKRQSNRKTDLLR